MAWQLIYTSAPRLLEAGRTGFGTVARHRAVSGMLASTVERFSQFARLPGYDPRRVVHTYRLLTVAGGTYHVFSCLKDAGSDYTGRTNHLAQHVIAEAREIRALAAGGLTPADVLHTMPWRSAWNEAPRFLDPGEEIDLAAFRAATSSAWASITGNPAHARLLCTPQTLKGCYIIIPPEVHGLELFRESMLEAPQAGWQTSLTTSLEPNDDVGDFRWIGLPPASPLRAQAEVSNRPLLDLTQPARLPAPPEPPAQPAPPPPRQEVAVPAEVKLPGESRSPDRVTLSRPPAQPAPALTTMGGWTPEPRKEAHGKKGKNVLLALVGVCLLGASVAGFLVWRHMAETKERAAFQTQIKQVWDEYGLVLPETRKRISEEQNLEQGQALLRSLQAYVEGVQRWTKNSGSREDPPHPENTNNLPDFTHLSDCFEKWKKTEGQGLTITGKTGSDLLTAYGDWVGKRQTSWEPLSGYLTKIGPVPAIHQDVVNHISEKAKDFLRNDMPAKADISRWEQLHKQLSKQLKKNDTEISEWLNTLTALDGTDNLGAAKKAKSNKSLPPWLIKKAQEILSEEEKSEQAKKKAKEKAMQAEAATASAATAAKIDDADSLESRHPIYICILKKGDASIAVNDPTGLPLESEMHIYVGGAWDKHPRPIGTSTSQEGELSLWPIYESKYFRNIFKAHEPNLAFAGDGKTIHLSEDILKSDQGRRIVARNKDDSRVLFEVRIVPVAGAAAKPVLWQTVATTVLNSGDVKLQGIGGVLSRLKGWASSKPSYKLRFEGSASASEQSIYELRPADDSSYSVIPPLQVNSPLVVNSGDLDRRIRELEDGIKQDDKDLKKNDDSKSSDKIKEENRKKYSEAKSKKEAELTQLKAKRQEQQNPGGQKPPPFELKPGTYMLIAITSSGRILEICKIQLSADKGESPPSPKQL